MSALNYTKEQVNEIVKEAQTAAYKAAMSSSTISWAARTNMLVALLGSTSTRFGATPELVWR